MRDGGRTAAMCAYVLGGGVECMCVCVLGGGVRCVCVKMCMPGAERRPCL